MRTGAARLGGADQALTLASLQTNWELLTEHELLGVGHTSVHMIYL